MIVLHVSSQNPAPPSLRQGQPDPDPFSMIVLHVSSQNPAPPSLRQGQRQLGIHSPIFDILQSLLHKGNNPLHMFIVEASARVASRPALGPNGHSSPRELFSMRKFVYLAISTPPV